MNPHDHLPTRELLQSHVDRLTTAIDGCPRSAMWHNARQVRTGIRRRLASDLPLLGPGPGGYGDAGFWGPNGHGPAVDDAVRGCEWAKAHLAPALAEAA